MPGGKKGLLDSKNWPAGDEVGGMPAKGCLRRPKGPPGNPGGNPGMGLLALDIEVG